MIDYNNGKIYLLKYRNDNNLFYVGCSTQQLNKRLQQHRRNYYSRNYYLYKKMRDTNDIKNWYIELYENFPCSSKYELEAKEKEIIELLKPPLNVYGDINDIKEKHNYKELNSYIQLRDDKKNCYNLKKQKLKNNLLISNE